MHEDLGIGSGTQLSYIGNTLMEQAQYSPQVHAFADKIDGSDRYKNPEGQKRKSIRWLALSDWDGRVFTNAGWQLTNGVKLKKALSYAEFLYYKAKYYGTDFVVSDQSNLEVPAAAEIGIFPNPASDQIHVALPFDQEQIESIRIIEPVSGNVFRTFAKDLPSYSTRDISLDVSVLPDGLYVILIQTENRSVSQKFIKL